MRYAVRSVEDAEVPTSIFEGVAEAVGVAIMVALIDAVVSFRTCRLHRTATDTG